MKKIRILSILLTLSMMLQFATGSFPIMANAASDTKSQYSEAEHSHSNASALSAASASVAGDMNENGTVDVGDAIYLLRHVLLSDQYPITQSGDMDGDGDVDVADAIYLLRHTLLPDKYPLNVHIHTVVRQDAVAVTCTRSGLTAGSYCSECNQILEAQQVITPTGHDSTVVEQVLGNCTEDGFVREYCSVCDTYFLSELTYAAGHSFGETTVVTEASCEGEGLSTRACEECDYVEENVMSATGHTLIASDTTEEGTVIYVCGECGYTTDNGSAADAYDEKHIYQCDKDFSFEIVCFEDEAYIREHLIIVDAYYADDPDIDADAIRDYELEYQGDGVWIVKPVEEYEGGSTYRATVNEEVKFVDYTGDLLYFTIADENHVELELNDGIIFIVLPEQGTADRRQYTLLTTSDNELFYLTLPDEGKFAEEHIGRIICAGAYTCMDEFVEDSSKECYFGKIEKVYATADGRVMLVLSCPALEEIFTKLDIYETKQIEITEDDISDELGAQAVSALLASEDFNEFLTGVTIASRSYASSMGVEAAGVSDLSFLDDMALIPKISIENGTTLVVSIQGNIPVTLMNSEGNKCGTIVVSFTAKAEFSFEATGICEFEYFWGVPTRVKQFDFHIKQTSSYTLDISTKITLNAGVKEQTKSIVQTPLGFYHLSDCLSISNFPTGSLTAYSFQKLDAEYRKNGGSVEHDCSVCNPTMSYLKTNVYVVNQDTKTVHRFVCTEADRLSATTTEVLTSIPTMGTYTYCQTCLLGNGSVEEQTYEEMLVNALHYQNWSNILQSIKDKINKKQDSDSKETQFTLLNLPVVVGGIFQISLEANMVISFKFSGSVAYSYNNTITSVTGVRLNSSSTLEPYSSREMKNESATFKIAGGLDVKAGVRIQVRAGLAGLLSKFVYVSIGAEVGTYSALNGIIYIDQSTENDNGQIREDKTSFAAAYWEMGLYGDIVWEYKVVFWGNKFSLLGGDKRLPLLAIGYDKVYYGYSGTIEEMDAVGNKVDLSKYNLLIANAFDVKKLSSSQETLNILGVSGEYDVIITVLDENGLPSPYCTVTNGVILISEDAPCDLTLKVSVTVNGKIDAVDTIADFIKQDYTVGDDLYKLPDYTFQLHVTNHTMSEWVLFTEPTCTEEGSERRYSTCDCDDVEFRPVAALGHITVVDEALAPTCTTDGATEGSHCGRCGIVFVEQIVRLAYGHKYADEFTCHDSPCLNDGCDHVEFATTEHRYSQWYDVPVVGCVTESYQLRYCLDCLKVENSLTDGDLILHLHAPSEPTTIYPTCTEDGSVTCYCLNCGNDLINETLEKTGHSLSGYLHTAEGHYRKCRNSGCTYATETEEHGYTNACDTDCNVCGRTRTTEHTWNTEYSMNGSYHWFECAICDVDDTKEAHSYRDDCAICDVCGYESANKHSWSTEYSIDGGSHWYVCTVCGADGIKTSHSYRNDCAFCDVCGHASDNAHDWRTEYSNNSNYHWYACTACQQKLQQEAHSYTESEPKYPATSATCESAATYYYYCVCGKIGTTTFVYGEVLGHDWSNEYTVSVRTHYYECVNGCGSTRGEGEHIFGDYVVTKAPTCTAEGEKTRSCTVCGHSEGRGIAMIDHTYGTDYSYDAACHWHKCTACGEKDTAYVHSLGDDLTCDVCGYVSTEDHDWFTVYCYDETRHWLECNNCGIRSSENLHDFQNACDTACSVCDHTRITEHVWSDAYASDGNHHWIECVACGEERDHTEHSYDHSCDTDCNVCGSTREIEHTKSDAYSTDGMYHWYECTVCGAVLQKTAHLGGTATCTEAADCADCGVAYGQALGHNWSEEYTSLSAEHYLVCLNGCGSVSERASHTCGEYEETVTPTCTSIGKEKRSCIVCGWSEERDLAMLDHTWSDEHSSDTSDHWLQCTACGTDGEKETHDYDHSCDTDCNVCGRVREIRHTWKSEYSFDGANHWRVCDVCGETDESAAHRYDHDCDTDCNVCGSFRTTQHIWSDKFSSDETNHWYECTVCGEESAKGVHDGGMATCTERAICALCGSEYGETIEHNYVMCVEIEDYLVRAVDCETQGIYYYSCVCGKAGTATFTVDPLGHDWSTEYSYDGSYHWLECNRTGCGETDGKSAHFGGTATCLEKAVCTACGEIYGSYGVHNYSVQSNEHLASNATCESPAYYFYACAYCGKAGTTTYPSGTAMGHMWSNEYTVTDSRHYYECLNNGCASVSGDSVHLYGDYAVTNAPTCTAEGEEIRVCTACGHSDSRSVEKLNHVLSTEAEVVIQVIEGDDQDLYIHHIAYCCINCDYYVTQASSSAHAHKAVTYVLGTPASCTENGLTGGVICAVVGCGEVRIEQKVIEAQGHEFVDGICTRCGEVEVYYSKGLAYTLSDDETYYIVSGKGSCTDTDIVIPAEYNSLPVKEIGSAAFAYESGIVAVTLPESVLTIASSAFECCIDLATISMPNSVCSIGSRAFFDCGKLIEITLPERLQILGDQAFYGCVALERIKFNAIIMNDLSLTGINENYISVSNDVFSYAGTNTNGIVVTVGAKVTRIPAYLFYSNQSSAHAPLIGSVVFEEGSVCREIGDHAFRQVDGLVSVRFPASLMTIGSYAFGYTDLKSVQFAEGNLQTIGAWAFRDCKNLSWLQLPDGIKTIDKGAFNGCTALMEITLPASLQTLGLQAFYNCTALEWIYYNATALEDLESNNYTFGYAGSQGNGISVVIGANVEKIPAYLFCPYYTSEAPKIVSVTFASGSQCSEIGTYAFAYCDELTEITIPSGVKTLGDFAFRECTGLTTLYFDAVAMNDIAYGGVFDNAGTASGGMTVYVDAGVTRVPGSLFSAYMYSSTYFPYVKTVVFEEGSVCTEIGRDAFSHCHGLEEITIPIGVRTIGAYAFYGCSSIAAITIPTGVRTIGAYAFYGCSSIAAITIPTGVTVISESTFEGCSALENIYFNSISMEDLDFYLDIFRDAGTNGNGIAITIGKQVTRIPSALFSGMLNVTSIQFEAGSVCEELGYMAFAYLGNVKEIVLPDSILTIGEYAFESCTSLERAILPKHLTKIETGAFMYCSSLSEIVLTNEITEIGNCAFEGCTSLADFTFPSQLRIIGTSAFSGCTSLTEVNLPESLTELGGATFYNCTALKRITIPSLVTELCQEFFNCTALEEIYFNAIELDVADSYYADTSFGNVGTSGDGITVTIGAQVTRIPDWLFGYSAANIKSVVFESGSQCLYIGNSAFAQCSSLTQIVFPASVITIGESAFWQCTGLKSVTLPENLKTIGENVFAECVQLTNLFFNAIEMDDILDSEYFNFFLDAGAESGGFTVTVGSKVKRIPAQLFYRYTYDECEIFVKKVVFASGSVCESIGGGAFMNCAYLTSINFPSSLKMIEGWAFAGCISLASVTLPTGLTEIGEFAFYWCTSLTRVSLGNSLQTIGESAFEYCIQLTSVSIPGTVDMIGVKAFCDCTGMKTLSIGNGVVEIGMSAFWGCTSLTAVTVPNSVEIIGDGAFGDCSALKIVTLGKGVTYLGWAAFGACTSMPSITFTGNAPEFEWEAFYQTTATVYYPSGNSTWTAAKRQNYGGTLTWVAK